MRSAMQARLGRASSECCPPNSAASAEACSKFSPAQERRSCWGRAAAGTSAGSSSRRMAMHSIVMHATGRPASGSIELIQVCVLLMVAD